MIATRIIPFIKSSAGELLIILSFLFIVTDYLSPVDEVIKADGMGYYDYLPAAIIYGDLLDCKKDSVHNSIANMREGYFLPYKEKCVTKYPCGTAILLSPFFLYAHLTAPIKAYPNNGYSKPYQLSVFYGAVFYLFLGLIFIKKLLSLYSISRPSIFMVQLFITLSTSLIHYTYYDSAFSHVYSFFAISAFSFFVRSFFVHKKINHFMYACILLGIVFLLRNVNILIVLFIPFLAGSWENLVLNIKYLFHSKVKLLCGVLFFLCIIFIQLLLWHLQTGDFFVFSYQGESFNFFDPAFFNILFSYRKGLFIYSPLLFFSLFGLIYFITDKKNFLFISWVLFFIVLTYMLSSWWSWYYGYSYGMRVYIDFYAVFCIPLGILIDRQRSYIKILIVLLLLPTVLINILQTYQYKEYILNWGNMNKDSYWNVFLKTGDQFKGLTWKKEFHFNDQSTQKVFSQSIPDVVVPAGEERIIYIADSDSIPDFNKVNIIQVHFENDFSDKQKSEIDLTIRNIETDKIHYFHNPKLLFFVEGRLNKHQVGIFNYDFKPVNDGRYKISLLVVTNNREVLLKNIRINYLIYTL